VIRLALLDDHQLMTQALALVLAQEPDLALAGSAATCAEGVALVARVCPDILVLDVHLPDGDGLTLIPQLRAACAQTQILVLTSMADEHVLLRAVEAGVAGFVSKHQPVADVLAAIRQAAAGEVVMPAKLLVGLLQRQRSSNGRAAPPAVHDHDSLTARELEVLACAAQGYSTTQIAERLSISALTVRTHLRNVMSKLNAHSRLEAVAIALRQGWIDPPR
jgi:DNA-binding NarL/FixJ family response regulator